MKREILGEKLKIGTANYLLRKSDTLQAWVLIKPAWIRWLRRVCTEGMESYIVPLGLNFYISHHPCQPEALLFGCSPQMKQGPAGSLTSPSCVNAHNPHKVPLWCVLTHVWLSATPLPVACQAPLSMEFSRQEHWSKLSFHTAGDLRNPGI